MNVGGWSLLTFSDRNARMLSSMSVSLGLSARTGTNAAGGAHKSEQETCAPSTCRRARGREENSDTKTKESRNPQT